MKFRVICVIIGLAVGVEHLRLEIFSVQSLGL
jgi:hypothetical protein